MSDDIIGFGEGDKAVLSGGKAEKYKGRTGEKDRIALCWLFTDDQGKPQFGGTPKFKSVNTHYVNGLGYFESMGEATSSRFGAPKRRIGTFVVHYRTDKQGQLFKGESGKPIVDLEVKEWSLNESKYRTLYGIHQEFNLTQCDLRVECTDATFQNMTFTPTNGEALWLRDPEVRQRVLDEVAALAPQMSLARKLTLEEIKDHLGEGESVVANVSSDVDYDDLMDDL